MFKIYREIFDFFNANIKEISLVVLIAELPLILLNNTISKDISSQAAFLILFFGIVSMAISNSAMTVVFSMILHKEVIDFKKAFINGFKYLPKMILAILIYGFFVAAGLILFIIPGIVIGSRLSLYNYYIVYENMDPFQAIKASAISTRGFTFEITILFVGIFFIVTTPYFITAKYLLVSKITNPAVFIGSDVIFSILGTLILILTFRVYCMIKEKKGIYF